MSKYYYILLLTITFLFLSCEKQIDLKLPPTSQKITIMGVQAQNIFLNATIGRSRSLTESFNYNDPASFLINNALVQVFVNGSLTDTLRFNTNASDYRSTRTRVLPGVNYKFVVNATGFTTAEAEAVAMQPVPILNITRRASSRTGNFGEAQDELLITFRDVDPGKNYYRFLIRFANNFGFACINSTDGDLIQFEIVDPLAGNTSDVCFRSGNMLMTDDNFNMQTKTLRLFIDREALKPIRGTGTNLIRSSIILQHIPRSYFEYLKTIKSYNDNIENPFAEPLNVFSNVKNGYGLYVPLGQAVDSIR